MRVTILQFPGSNCDDDAMHVITKVLGEEASFVWHKESRLPDRTDAVIPRAAAPPRAAATTPAAQGCRRWALASWRAPGRERGVGAGGRLGGAGWWAARWHDTGWAHTAGARGWWKRPFDSLYSRR